MGAKEELNCIDIVKPYVEAIGCKDMPRVQLLGGVGSVALLNEATVIKADEKRIVAPASISLSNYRDDGNQRDIETLVLSSNQEHTKQVEACAKQTMGDKLIIEVFGFGDIRRVGELKARPFGFKALNSWVSDRYMEVGADWATDSTTPLRMLFPFSAPIPIDALETWTLEIGDDLEIPVPSPGAVIINYLIRSISGLRDKDSRKIEQMGAAIFKKSPEQVDWIIDGPGRSQFEIARLLHTLREPKQDPKVLTIGEKLAVCALQSGQILEHPAFMLNDEDRRTQQTAIRLAAAKSRALHRAESVSFLVTAFQKYVEPRVGSIIHNK